MNLDGNAIFAPLFQDLIAFRDALTANDVTTVGNATVQMKTNLDTVLQARGEIGSFRLSGGGGGKLPRADKLATAKFLVVPALVLLGGVIAAAPNSPGCGTRLNFQSCLPVRTSKPRMKPGMLRRRLG